MKRVLVPMLGLLLAGAAAAQSGYFVGVTPRPTDLYPLAASVTVTRTAPAGGLPNVAPALYTHVTTQPTSKSLEWANLTILNNPSADQRPPRAGVVQGLIHAPFPIVPCMRG